MAPETQTYCARCGTSLAPGAYFCLRCGTSVPVTTGGASATVAPPPRRPSPHHTAQLDALRKATLGEYEVLAELGRGGMATVYLAHDLALDRKVAIKVLAPALLLMGEGMVERFKREARTAAALSHPHIIPIYAVKESDFLSLHAPSVPETKGIINADTLRQMKPGAILINTARGDLVREEALAQALEEGRLGGAGLDVYLEEPAVHARLRAAPRAVLLPHIGSATLETRRQMAAIAVANVQALLKGDPPLTPVFG